MQYETKNKFIIKRFRKLKYFMKIIKNISLIKYLQIVNLFYLLIFFLNIFNKI